MPSLKQRKATPQPTLMDSVSNIRIMLKAAQAPLLGCPTLLYTQVELPATGAFCGFFSKHAIGEHAVVSNGDDI